MLLHTLAEKGLRGTEPAKAQFDTIILKVLKIGARVVEGLSRIRVHLPSVQRIVRQSASQHYPRDVAMPIITCLCLEMTGRSMSKTVNPPGNISYGVICNGKYHVNRLESACHGIGRDACYTQCQLVTKVYE